MADVLLLPLLLVIVLSLVVQRGEAAFAVLGDWGRGGHHHQLQVAHTLRSSNVSFVITVGDNFYPHGIASITDDNIKQWVEYYDEPMRVPWYVALGNHDHEGNVSAQVALTETYKHWHLPAPYYDIVTEEGHFFILDTTPWVGGEDVEGQKEWLAAKMAESKDGERLYVVGHHPLWTCGAHRNEDVEGLKSTLLPLLQQHGAIYLSGHDHNLQHIVRGEGNVQQYISGGGSYRSKVTSCEGMKFGLGDEGFLLVDGSSHSFIGRHGDVLYSN